MAGPQGLPALLAEQGFRVERVAFAPAGKVPVAPPKSGSKEPLAQ
ncbi:hypothetical protein AcdelDRAFT_3813 [Acidovorax delafieldii 2AN]|uniref:Uncharacterized protein n=1 Tax=Acidovorax delafieldii 2AN TaxID=573060 RepID=C5TA83_ACIDE|nr:hypothetical protein AcdelDRAFT_3813 [Acidovorax delafieldii 2AN]